MPINDMKSKFIKKITSEGKRKVINVPKKSEQDFQIGESVLVSKINYNELTKEEIVELLEK